MYKLVQVCLVIFMTGFMTFSDAFVFESKRTYSTLPEFSDSQRNIQDSVKSNDLLPLYFHHFKPTGSLVVDYFYKEDIPVNLGNYISPLYSIDTPKFSFQSFFKIDESFKNDLYSIIMTDLDPISQKCHAIWTNIKIDPSNVKVWNDKDDNGVNLEKETTNFEGSFVYHFDLEDGRELVPYVGPRPKEDTGVHRYLFILFRQPYGKLPFEQLNYRDRWGSKIVDHGVQDWAKYYGLQPLAVNFFRSSNEGLF